MSISQQLNRWRSGLVALVVALTLVACGKGDASPAQPGAKPTANNHTPPAGAPATAVKPHGSHDAAHGGVVMMDAEHHVEIVLDATTGKHRAYVSDGARDQLPASTFDEVELTVAGEVLSMTREPGDQFWEVTGKPSPAADGKVSIAYSKAGKEVAHFDDLPLEYVLTGKMAGAENAPHEHADGKGHDHGAAADHGSAAAGEHAHAAPHGGQVKTSPAGHIELVADASGTFAVWLLDAQLAPRPVAGASVKIKVAAKGYADVVAAVQGDHFEGKGAAIPGEHAVAVVTATIGGKTETARFELHLEAAHDHAH